MLASDSQPRYRMRLTIFDKFRADDHLGGVPRGVDADRCQFAILSVPLNIHGLALWPGPGLYFDLANVELPKPGQRVTLRKTPLRSAMLVSIIRRFTSIGPL